MWLCGALTGKGIAECCLGPVRPRCSSTLLLHLLAVPPAVHVDSVSHGWTRCHPPACTDDGLRITPQALRVVSEELDSVLSQGLSARDSVLSHSGFWWCRLPGVCTDGICPAQPAAPVCVLTVVSTVCLDHTPGVPVSLCATRPNLFPDRMPGCGVE